jgi:predicted nucleic acid-binding protein
VTAVLILIDTNVLLRMVQEEHPHSPLANQAVEGCGAGGFQAVIVPQVVYEFWVVATRPLANNGLGYSAQQARASTDGMLKAFTLIRDERTIFEHWRVLLDQYEVLGKMAHDARLVAAMKRHRMQHILTFNSSDFARYDGIVAVSPAEAAARSISHRETRGTGP